MDQSQRKAQPDSQPEQLPGPSRASGSSCHLQLMLVCGSEQDLPHLHRSPPSIVGRCVIHLNGYEWIALVCGISYQVIINLSLDHQLPNITSCPPK
jgi:hypothetical protein